MMTASARGWRRSEPGQVKVLEQSSLLPRAVELLTREGVDLAVLASECRAPVSLFQAVSSRVPLLEENAPVLDNRGGRTTTPAVVSLLPRLEANSQADSVGSAP